MTERNEIQPAEIGLDLHMLRHEVVEAAKALHLVGITFPTMSGPNELEQLVRAIEALKAGEEEHANILAAAGPSVENPVPLVSASDEVEGLLRALDVLYQYASDEGCPNAESHKFQRPNRARQVVEAWLSGMKGHPREPHAALVKEIDNVLAYVNDAPNAELGAANFTPLLRRCKAAILGGQG